MSCILGDEGHEERDLVTVQHRFTLNQAQRALKELRDAASLLWMLAEQSVGDCRREILDARNRNVMFGADLADAIQRAQLNDGERQGTGEEERSLTGSR